MPRALGMVPAGSAVPRNETYLGAPISWSIKEAYSLFRLAPTTRCTAWPL